MGKKILVTGKNSYIGISFASWLKAWPNNYMVDTVSTLNDEWLAKSFAGYSAVLHVAAVVHQKEGPEMADLYKKVNTQLTIDIAGKSKRDGVRQFIFMSTMNVYGRETGTINSDTLPAPKTMYGKSKLDAERLLKELADESFQVAVLRPPMVYGPGCPGNYARLTKLIKKTPVFPKVFNKRSMIYIENLCEFLRQIIDNKERHYKNDFKVFFPQNKEYVCTSELAACIAKNYGKRLRFSRLLGGLAGAVPLNMLRKVFGSLVYEKSMSSDFSYSVVDFEESVHRSV